MDNKQKKSNVMLSSNIMLRSRYNVDSQTYIPADLLQTSFTDARAVRFLSPSQQKQMKKKLFYASCIVDEE